MGLADYSTRLGVDFSNILSKTAIERLADVDEYEVVREVQVSVIVHIPLKPCSTPECAQLLWSGEGYIVLRSTATP